MSKKVEEDIKSEELTIQLSKAIMAHGEEVSSLTLCQPTGKDVREIGIPFVLSPDLSVTIRTDIAAKLISRLASIPLSSVDQMNAADMTSVSWAVVGFFLKQETMSEI